MAPIPPATRAAACVGIVAAKLDVDGLLPYPLLADPELLPPYPYGFLALLLPPYPYGFERVTDVLVALLLLP